MSINLIKTSIIQGCKQRYTRTKLDDQTLRRIGIPPTNPIALHRALPYFFRQKYVGSDAIKTEKKGKREYLRHTWSRTLALETILTATVWPLMSPFFALAKHVFPKWPRPTSFPSSYLDPKFFPYPKFLFSVGFSAFPVASSAVVPSLGLPGSRRLASAALMCFAGDGGGKGRRKNRRGVELAGEGETPAGNGLAEPWVYGLGQQEDE